MQLFYPLGLPSDDIGIDGFHDTKKNQSQSYIPITGCVLSHILSSLELSSLEKMYYILADSISYINSSKGRNRSVSIPATSWAERLVCSKSEIFTLQKSLEDKGYFIIYRDKNDKGQNNRNTITTTIPDHVFNDLKYEPDRFNLNYDGEIDDKIIEHSKLDNIDSIDKTFIPTLEGKRQHLAKTKMFIRVPYQFLKELNFNCSISATSKIVLLYLFMKMYKSSVRKYDHGCSGNRYDYNNAVDGFTNNTGHLYSIVTSYQELQTELKLHRNSLTKALKLLEAANLIKRDQIVIKSDDDYNSRADKSLWQISLLNATLITNLNDQQEQTDRKEHIDLQEAVINNQNQKEYIGEQQAVMSEQTKVGYNNNEALESSKEWECTKYDPACTDSSQLYIKDFIVNNSIIKNIDDKDVKSEEAFLGNEQSSFPSESYYNCSFLNNPSKNNDTEKKEDQKELRDFYPLSEQDISMLNSRANREFSNNFVNQLLLKLYIKYPEKRFKNRFTFLSYMVQILSKEKHQGPLVNHTSFRFSCNIGTEDKNQLEYERYLNQIEDSLDLSKEMQLKKKIAGRFSSEVAYKILTKVKFKLSPDNSFITALIPNNLAAILSERQIATLSDQLEAVYGINGYYVQEVEEDAIQPPRSKTCHIDHKEKPNDILEAGSKLDTKSENTLWHQIRKGLREELGDHIDKAWFAKAEAIECKETKTLTITMPTRFMIDWVRNNYSHVIRRLSKRCGVNKVSMDISKYS